MESQSLVANLKSQTPGLNQLWTNHLAPSPHLHTGYQIDL